MDNPRRMVYGNVNKDKDTLSQDETAIKMTYGNPKRRKKYLVKDPTTPRHSTYGNLVSKEATGEEYKA